MCTGTCTCTVLISLISLFVTSLLVSGSFTLFPYSMNDVLQELTSSIPQSLMGSTYCNICSTNIKFRWHCKECEVRICFYYTVISYACACKYCVV